MSSIRRIKRRPLRKAAIGDRRDRIRIHTRAITPPPYDSASFTETYDAGVATWAKVESAREAEHVFDNVNLPAGATPSHIFDIRYRPGVTTENVISYRDEYYRILRVEDPEERRLSLLLYAALRGDESLEANQ